MSFGIRTYNTAGALVSEFGPNTMRLIARVRVEKSTSGSFATGRNRNNLLVSFARDTFSTALGPKVTVNANGVISWAPYPGYTSFHVGGYLLVLEIA